MFQPRSKLPVSLAKNRKHPTATEEVLVHRMCNTVAQRGKKTSESYEYRAVLLLQKMSTTSSDCRTGEPLHSILTYRLYTYQHHLPERSYIEEREKREKEKKEEKIRTPSGLLPNQMAMKGVQDMHHHRHRRYVPPIDRFPSPGPNFNFLI